MTTSLIQLLVWGLPHIAPTWNSRGPARIHKRGDLGFGGTLHAGPTVEMVVPWAWPRQVRDTVNNEFP